MASVAELLPRAARLKYELEVQLRAVEQGAGDAGAHRAAGPAPRRRGAPLDRSFEARDVLFAPC